LSPGIAASPTTTFGGIRSSGTLPYPTPLPIAPGYPRYGVTWGGFGYGFGGYPYYYSYSIPAPAAPVQAPEPEAGPNIALVNVFPASLTLEFPAPAEVWVNGKKGEGEPTMEWNLNSPQLKVGTDFTFEVKARWKVGGKTYEYERTIVVAAGNRSRALVISGNLVKE
jgi:uncharacterized protein (TIGR03000 family)